MNTDKKKETLEDRVRDAIGKESLGRLAKQPLATSNGGIASILRTACKEAAGYPDPLAAGIAKVRVMCGSKALPPITDHRSPGTP
jgi:hypothetical protein